MLGTASSERSATTHWIGIARDRTLEVLFVVTVVVLATFGSGSAYGAVRIWIAADPRIATVTGVSYANLSRATPDMTFISAEGQDFIWSWHSHEPIAVGDQVAMFRDEGSNAAVAFPAHAPFPSFLDIAVRAVFPPWLWVFPITLASLLALNVVRYVRAVVPWLTAPLRTWSSSGTDGKGRTDLDLLAEAISHTTRRSVVVALCLVCIVVIGEGLFYVQRFSTLAVGLYFTTLVVLVDFRFPDWLASAASAFGRSVWHSLARIVVSLAVLILFISKAVSFLRTDLSRFDTIGDLLWEFVATILA